MYLLYLSLRSNNLPIPPPISTGITLYHMSNTFEILVYNFTRCSQWMIKLVTFIYWFIITYSVRLSVFAPYVTPSPFHCYYNFILLHITFLNHSQSHPSQLSLFSSYPVHSLINKNNNKNIKHVILDTTISIIPILPFPPVTIETPYLPPFVSSICSFKRHLKTHYYS